MIFTYHPSYTVETVTLMYYPSYTVETVTEMIGIRIQFEKKQFPVLWGGFLSFVLVFFFINSSVLFALEGHVS